MRTTAAEASRHRDAVSAPTQIWFTAYSSPSEVRAAEAHLARDAGAAPGPQPVPAARQPAQMVEALLERREAYGLDRTSLKEDVDALRFCREVLPLLGC